jgi:preprotein translocase subunit SecA
MALFGKKKPERPPVTVWMKSEYKFQAIARAVKTSVAASTPVVIVAHFADALRQIQTALEKENLPVEVISLGKIFGVPTFLKEATSRKAATLALSDVFPLATSATASPEKSSVQIIVAELYPTPERDRTLQELFLTFGIGLRYHAALDDALMKRFGSEKIAETLKMLGGNDDEPIEHELVTKSILNAQAKVKETAKSDFKSDSADEWFKKNCVEQTN